MTNNTVPQALQPTQQSQFVITQLQRITVGQRIKIVLWTIGGFVILAMGAMLAILLFQKSPAGAIDDFKRAFRTRKSVNGTQVLPPRPNLDSTLDNISNDIING